MANFTVDTHLFRELGELLVGRDSTALIELIKNSYDADATEVVVLGLHLNDPKKGLIVIRDNGTGMTPMQFERGFLRVASRLKDDGERRSQRLKRRYTGAKGIGRLAAHKLAKLLKVKSIPWIDPEQEAAPSADARTAVEARIDWDAIEKFETLDEIDGSNAVHVDHVLLPESASCGTVLRLSKLRRRWSKPERARFFAEVQSFAPPDFLTTQLRRSVVSKQLLFKEPFVRHATSSAPAFQVRLEGEFASGDDYWRLIEEHASWVIEISCRPCELNVHYAVEPTRRTLRSFPEARPYTAVSPHPLPDEGPFFDARIFMRAGQLSVRGPQRSWMNRSSGIRVYMEGFRVLPYGEPLNDWLRIDADVARRTRTQDTLRGWNLSDLEHQDDPDAGLSTPPNSAYFGGVFLTQENAGNMRMLVNREGFVPEVGYDNLVHLVRTGVDLCTRVHTSASFHQRQARREQRQKKRSNEGGKPLEPAKETLGPGPVSLRTSLQDATDILSKARTHLVATAETEEAKGLVQKMGETLEDLLVRADQADEMISEQSMLRVLASVGTQMSAFVHEIRALLGASQAVEHALGNLASDANLAREQRRKLKRVLQAIGDLRRGLEREASYLTDIVSPDARRRRSRQKLFERFDVASRLVAHSAERRGIRIDNSIPKTVKSPPMFPAELTAVFTNLLSNAVKAAGSSGRIEATAWADSDGSVRLLLQNTGVAVDLAQAETWFRPFESTTADIDPVLGQGMGLGLPITRRLLDDYGAEIRFVRPVDDSLATAIQITFPGDRYADV
ncbi:MAG: ATP-binding protein [Deltaproteobacteria bacterium]|nr:ATP-binding protein [Deltaproteobacteria bacterium]